MTDEKKVLLISKGQGLSTADRKALEDAGYIVVRVKFPSDVRFITKDEPPMTANDMLRAAIQGIGAIAYEPSRKEAQSAAWKALCNVIMASH